MAENGKNLKIFVTCRTRNEEANIARFCDGYSWADRILIADGGSEDKTVEIAESYQKVTVRPFHKRVYGKNNLWRNPHGEHMNFIWKWAMQDGADWIVFDDCDCIPTRILREEARGTFALADQLGCKSIWIHRLYLYKEDKYFPDMNKPGQTVWAWKRTSPVWANESDPWRHEIRVKADPSDGFYLERPYCLLHKFAPDEETIQRKKNFYVMSGQHPSMQHPLKFGGRLESLPKWAH